jgi:hypothetical protein
MDERAFRLVRTDPGNPSASLSALLVTLAGLFHLVFDIFDTTMGKERPLLGVTKRKVSEDKVSKNEGRHKKHKRHNVKHENSDDESSKVGLKSPKLAQGIVLALRPHSQLRSDRGSNPSG